MPPRARRSRSASAAPAPRRTPTCTDGSTRPCRSPRRRYGGFDRASLNSVRPSLPGFARHRENAGDCVEREYVRQQAVDLRSPRRRYGGFDRASLNSVRPSLPGFARHRENAGDCVEREYVRQQAVDLQAASQQLHRHAAADLVDVDRQTEWPDLQVAKAHHRVRVGADGDGAAGLQAVVHDELAALEIKRHGLGDVGDEDPDASDQVLEVALLLLTTLDVGLDQASEHRGERARLLVGVLDQLALIPGGLQLSSGHSTGTRVVHSVISCDAFVYRTIVGRSPFSLSLPCSMPFVASSCLVATSFHRVYGAVMTKSHFCASAAPPTVTLRALPSYRSITMPFALGKCLSGSASTTRPTVHFQPFPACS